MQTDSSTEALAALAAAGEIWIFSHQRPDGDALGSSLGLGLTLEAVGKKIRIFNQDPVSDLYQFLPGQDKVEPTPTTPPGPGVFLLALDTSTLERLGPSFLAWNQAPDLSIDHHESNTRFAKINLVDPSEPSTASLVMRLLDQAGWVPPATAASNLFVGLTTDTGSFCYRGTTAKTFRTAARLVELGADPSSLARECYQSTSPERFQLRRLALQSIRFHAGSRLATLDLTPEMFAESGARSSDTEGLVEEALTIRGVEISALFEIRRGDVLKVSLRSKGGTNVSQLAREFGGGGHPGAAGINFSQDAAHHQEAVLNRLLSLFP